LLFLLLSNRSRRKMKAQSKVVSMFVLLALVLAACTTAPAPTTAVPMAAQATAASTEASTAAQPAAGASVAVTIQNFAFDPGNLTVKTGTTVTWTNLDSANHTVTSDTGLFDSGELGKGSTFSYTFDKAGVYTYYCIPHHSKMQATVTVTD
jgi:plastocyanin